MIKTNIKDLLLSVTNFCLGSCAYCNLKNLDTFSFDDEWTIEDAKRLLADPLLEGLENAHITGGEPILSPKTYEVFKLLNQYHPDIRVNMPVSGFFPYATYRYIKKLLPLMPQLRIDISVDGATKEIHEKSRGKDTWEPLWQTIRLLKTLPLRGFQMQFTLMESNVHHIRLVQAMAELEGMGFYLCFPRYGTRFAHKEDKSHAHDAEFISLVDEQIKDGWCKIRPLNNRIWQTQKAIWEGKSVVQDCKMGLESIDIDPFGNCYPCMVYDKNQILGNIRKQTLTNMFECSDTYRILSEIKDKKCQPCIMPVCARKYNPTIDGVKLPFCEGDFR